jgi:eukaryotic-like serine/threonine-protein kinase
VVFARRAADAVGPGLFAAPVVTHSLASPSAQSQNECDSREPRAAHERSVVNDSPQPQKTAKVLAATVIGDAPPERDGSVIGPYKLLQKIGEGGFGVVYMAEQEQPVRRTVALKIIKPGMDTSEVIARFESERQALALMDHPQIARVLDVGATDSGRPYFVMELVKGVPITEFCDKNHLEPEARLKLFVDVCHAIQHAHHKGIIHRDIKPTNVMVTLHDGVPVVKVIDFGVAKAIVQKLTEKTLFTAYGQMVGTPAYMSPEQAEMSGLDIDTRSDVYSLGVLLYELLTGTTPLEAERLRAAAYAEMQRLICHEEPPRPSTRLSSLGDSATVVAGNRGLDVKRLEQVLSGDLDWVVMKALEKDRNRRYSTPGNFAEDIERYLQHEAIQARPPSKIYRLKKLAQRNRGAVVTAAVVALALLAGTAVSVWQALRATHAEAAAKAAAVAERQAKDEALIAATAERTAKDKAVAREADIKAVLGFVEDRIFAAARPEGQAGGLGHNVTLRKAIEAALPYVQKSFPSQPLIEARLRLTLGQSFFFLGDARTAAQQEEAARTLFTRNLGPDHPDTLKSMNALATSYDALARHDEALNVNEQTLALRKARLGPDDPDTLASMHNLATTYYFLGRYDEAIKLYQQTIALRRSKLGPDDFETQKSMHNVAMCYSVLGRYAEALKIYEELLASFTRKFGPHSHYTLQAQNGVAICEYALGRQAEALKLREETVKIAKVGLGADHPDTLMYMDNLSLSYDAARRDADALKLRVETLALKRAKLGPDHPSTLDSLYGLAMTYSKLARYTEAVVLNEETLALQRAKLGVDNPSTLQTMYELANSYDGVGRHTEALKLREETLALAKTRLGPDHRDTMIYMAGLANSQDAAGRHAEALKLRDDTLALQKAKLGADHPDRLVVMYEQAESYAALGRASDALKIREETLTLRKAKLGPDHADTLDSMHKLADSYDALGRHAEALKLREQTLALRKARLGPDSPDTLLSMGGLAKTLVAVNRGAEALPLIRQAAEKWEELKRSDPNSLYRAAVFHAIYADALRASDKSSSGIHEAEADRAVSFLKQAVAAGFQDEAHLKTDDSLDKLRGRKDFKELMAELERMNQSIIAKP